MENRKSSDSLHTGRKQYMGADCNCFKGGIQKCEFKMPSKEDIQIILPTIDQTKLNILLDMIDSVGIYPFPMKYFGNSQPYIAVGNSKLNGLYLYVGLLAKETHDKHIGGGLYEKGAVYQGFFHKNKPHGKGWYFWSNKDHYKGTWDSGVMSGEGVFTTKDGKVYEGEFEDGLLVYPENPDFKDLLEYIPEVSNINPLSSEDYHSQDIQQKDSDSSTTSPIPEDYFIQANLHECQKEEVKHELGTDELKLSNSDGGESKEATVNDKDEESKVAPSDSPDEENKGAATDQAEEEKSVAAEPYPFIKRATQNTLTKSLSEPGFISENSTMWLYCHQSSDINFMKALQGFRLNEFKSLKFYISDIDSCYSGDFIQNSLPPSIHSFELNGF